MSLSPDRIFISYSRADGRQFAESFERRLRRAGIKAWRDLKDMSSGDILPQVLEAIERCTHFVLILSGRALASDWIKREWSHARLLGKKVSPVLADASIKKSDLPPWIRREELYDIAEQERWTQLVRVLEGPGEVRCAPYMPGDDPPGGFVPRPVEFDKLKAAVLEAPSGKPVALTTALVGAGGFGKTVLANALCRDDDVRFEFTDGILRVEVGKERENVLGLVIDLIEKLDPDGKRPGFQDIVTASAHLGELVGESRILLVIDDVWSEAQLRPFLRGGPNCVLLVTTRLPRVLPASHIPVEIDEMREAEALNLLSANLPGAEASAIRIRLATLADRLGNWAQMLGIANGWMHDRVKRGESIENAIARFEQRLSARGLTAFDQKDEQQRNRAIRACVEASIEDLAKEELVRFGELAVLPEDESVPLSTIEELWHETGGFDADATDELAQRLDDLSLLQNLDLGGRTLRLHDNMIWYLRDRVGPDGCRSAHAAMVRAIGAACSGAWPKLPPTHAYGWRFLIRHLRAAGRDDEAEGLLTDYSWIRAKLQTSDAQRLFENYLPESETEAVRLVGRALALSMRVLATSPNELPRQIYGRLGAIANQRVTTLVASAQQDPDFRPAPRWPGLTPPGAERLRLVGHESWVWSASFSPDGGRIVTASNDRTARVWEPASGAERTVLRGHENWVNSASFSPDGDRIVTASADGTARVWAATSGAESAVLRGHADGVRSASFSTDGRRIVTASADRTARVWQAASGAECVVLPGHEGGVNSASFSPDGRHIVTASADRTARVWETASGVERAVLRGHEGGVLSASFSPDGGRIVTASGDGTARVWDAASGAERAVLCGDEGGVWSASFSPDGGRIVTASDDRTARVWEAASGAECAVLRGHEGRVLSASFAPDGSRIVTASDDRTARVWDAAGGAERAVLRGHEDRVRSASFAPDGGRIVTASFDRTARVWDAASGAERVVLRGHEDRVRSASFAPNGRHIVTASADRTARVWEAASGAERAVLRGHEGGVWSASFSPDGRFIVTASADFTARVWQAASGAGRAVLRGHEAGVYSASFAPDGRRIVTASADFTARVWDAAGGAERAVLRGHEAWVWGASFAPDGHCIVTASEDGTARVWEAASGAECLVLSGHKGGVNSASFSPDGTRIVTASYDRTARVWEASTGRQIASIALDAAVTAACWHGDKIALGDALGRIHVFDL
jgi:WD40 repeat protein